MSAMAGYLGNWRLSCFWIYIKRAAKQVPGSKNRYRLLAVPRKLLSAQVQRTHAQHSILDIESFYSKCSSSKWRKCNGLARYVCWYVSHWACLSWISPSHAKQGTTASKCCPAVSNAYPGMEQYSTVEDSERYSVNASSLSSVHTGERWS